MNRASHISSVFKYFLVEFKKSAVVCYVTILNMIISLIPNHKLMILSSVVPHTASNSSWRNVKWNVSFWKVLNLY